MPASWLPLAADYSRFGRRRTDSFLGAFVGYLIPNVWLYALGALLLLSQGLSDATSLLTAIAGGGIAAALALTALGIDETKEPFANVYSTAVSLQNLAPRVPQRLLIVVAAIGSTGAARGARALPRTRRVRSSVGAAGPDRRLAGGVLLLPVAPAGGPGLVDEPRGARAPGNPRHRRVAADSCPLPQQTRVPPACGRWQ
jgi:hypothetical protein